VAGVLAVAGDRVAKPPQSGRKDAVPNLPPVTEENRKEIDMKVKLLGLAVLCALAAAAPSFGQDTPIVAKVIAAGKFQATTIKARTGTTILESYRLAPGGSFGWHVHGAPVAVVVASGTLTVFDPTVGNCKPFRVSKGMSFVEPANHIHLARNDGKTPALVYALYLGLPTAADVVHSRAEPAGCKT
jgi:quercetin dioxygenase-like cupin family protein